MRKTNRKNKIRFKFVSGLIRGYRNEPGKPGVPEMQFQSLDGVAQTLTVGNIAKVYEVEKE